MRLDRLGGDLAHLLALVNEWTALEEGRSVDHRPR